MVNINQMMKQAQAMQKKVLDMQEKMALTEYEGTAGGNLVNIKINGKGHINKIKIDPSLIDPNEVEMLEDLIMAAFNDAKKKSDEESESSMSGMMGGLGLPPGFKMPF